MSSYNLVDVCDEVYNSTKKILERNQRHLYVNMLNLLSKTTKTSTDCSANDFATEKYVHFWYTEILPLVFDKDLEIQTNAIAAIQIAIDNLDIESFQKKSEWAAIRTTIVENYSTEIHNMREALNSNWYKIWCIVMRILNTEILRGAKVINTFLTIVELAFRSLDYNVRAEACICWQTLAEIFYKHNEICSQKRIKLLCIPLKSTQSKSLQAAINKLKVWWYLICKIQKQVDLNIEIIFDSFIKFCFGSVSNIVSSAKTYNEIKEMSTICFLCMLGCSNEEIQNKLEILELEPLQYGIINQKIMKTSWKLIIHASFEIIRFYANDENIIKLLWESLQPHFFKLGTVDLYEHFCKSLKDLSKEHPQIVSFIIKEMGSSEHFPYEMIEENNDCSSENIANIINIYLDLISSLSDLNENNVISLIEGSFDLKNIYLSKNFRKVISYVLQNIMENRPDDDYNKFQNKVVVWIIVSKNIMTHCKCSIDSLTTDELNTLFQWVIWPLETFTLYEGKLDTNCFGDTFCETWGCVLSFASKATIKLTYTTNLHNAFRKLADPKKPIRNYSKLLTHLISTIDVNFDISSKPQESLSLLSYIVSLPPFDNLSNDQFVQDFQKFVSQINEQRFEIIFDEIVEITKNIVVAAKSKYITAKVIDNLKINLNDKVKKMENKNLLKQIKNVFTSDNDFVIIPSVWSLKPDRLTEHQKEKMKVKRDDIPALYNDLSQSEDSSSIKPWTPKKIVLAKEKEDEISLIETVDMCSNNDDDTEIPTTINTLNNVNNHNKRKSQRREFTKEDEDLLKQLNIVIEDDKKKWLTLRELRSIKTNTVAGLPILDKTLRKTRSNDDKKENDIQENKNSSVNKENPRITRRAKRTIRSENKKIKKTNDIADDGVDDLSETLFTHRNNNLTKNANYVENVPTELKSKESDQIEVVTAIESEKPTLETNPIKEIIGHINTEANSELNSVPDLENELNQISTETKIDEPTCLSSSIKDDNQPIDSNAHSPPKSSPVILKETEEAISLSKELMLSKKKNSISLLSSPERKTINCSTSPLLKPKISSNLFGRGAQLINMIRNKKANYISKTNKLDAKTDEFSQPDSTGPILNTAQTTHNDILIFSKVLPASDASPSSSILKRKFRESNDNSAELQAHKRKRVSFHDPPVSVTKEYIKHDENGELSESRAKINLSRRLSATDSPNRFCSPLHSLKRKNRVDSINEISNFSETCTEKPETSSTIPKNTNNSPVTATETPSTSDIQNISNNLEPLLQIKAGNDENGLLNLIMEKYSMETLLQNYVKRDSAEASRCITNTILSIVKNDTKIKNEIFDKLAEAYPKSFLEHALQENLSSTVCESLTIDSIIEYVFNTSKQDISMRKQVLIETQALLKDEHFPEDSNNQLLYLLQNNKMTNEQILKYIEILASKRHSENS